MAGVVQDKVFEMDELAVDPERGAGVCEMGSFNPAGSYLGTGDPLIETRERGCRFYFRVSNRKLSYRR